MAVARKVFDEIKEIREDILGVYSFAGPRSPRIEIYWMAQALFAAAFGLRIEDLTVVTLCHELTHAYTHLGVADRRLDRGYFHCSPPKGAE